jgi:hypothetical protein
VILNDGTVIPSFLNVIRNSSSLDPGSSVGNITLRVGQVREIIYPEDKRSSSKKFIEYRVTIEDIGNQGSGATVEYNNCFLMNSFGGIADKLTYTLRADPKSKNKDDMLSAGSKVLVLCINGSSTNPVIVGGIRDSRKTEKKDSEDLGHNLFFEFNGLQATINDSGELQVKFRGKTKENGNLDPSANSGAEGTSILFDKDGNIKLATPNDDQKIEISHKDKKININAKSECNINVSGSANINASGSINLTTTSTCNLTAAGMVTIMSPGVSIGMATDATLKGSSFRNAQQDMHNNLKGALDGVAAALNTAASMLTWNIPGAAAALGSAAGSLGAASSALQSFESKSSQFLSDKNKSD